MDPSALQQFLDFASELEKLKKLERFKGQPFWRDYPEIPRYESVADHTWRLGMLVLMFAGKLAQEIDLEKALKMVLVHDLPEIITGDGSPIGEDGTGNTTYAFDAEKAHEKHAGEKEAAIQLFSGLPEEVGKEFYNIWLEYDLQTSFEAKVIKSLDKIEALLQVSQYRHGHLFTKHLEFNIAYALKWSEIDPAIAEFGNMIVEDMKKNFKEFKKNPANPILMRIISYPDDQLFDLLKNKFQINILSWFEPEYVYEEKMYIATAIADAFSNREIEEILDSFDLTQS